MRKSTRPLIIASRTSTLARVQAEMVGRLLAATDPTLKIEFRWIESDGDQSSATSLADAGGKGLFTRTIERAILEQRADLAVHSCKDLPTQPTTGLTIAAVPARADARDCLISAAGYPNLAALPSGAKVGTSSLRRAAQLKRLRPDLHIEPLRGNIDTRLRKVLQERLCDAAVLAVAGLLRVGQAEHARHVLETQDMLPAPGQGCLALQCRVDDHVTLRRCLPINDATAATAAHAERQVAASLGGDCHAALAVMVDAFDAAAADLASKSRQDRGMPHLRLRARVLSPDGQRLIQTQQVAPARHVGKMVKRAVAELKTQGAAELLARK